MTFLFIIGDTNLETWQDSGFSDMSSVNSSFNIVIDCAQSRRHHFVSHVSKEDDYHIVFFMHTPKPTTVETSFQLNRTKLVLSENDILESCYTRSEYDTCYLAIPYRQHHPVVLAMSPPAPSAEDEVIFNTYTVKFRCQDRGLLYIMLAIGSIILSFLVATMLQQVLDASITTATAPEANTTSLIMLIQYHTLLVHHLPTHHHHLMVSFNCTTIIQYTVTVN